MLNNPVTPPITPPNSPRGQLQVNELGDVSVTLTFPAEITSWSRLSARVDITPQGANVSGRTFEVRNFPVSPTSRTTQNVPLRSPNSHPRPDVPPLVYSQGSPSSRQRAPSPQASLHSALQNLHVAESVADPFDADGDEPEIAVNNLSLADIPDPVFPQVGGIRGPREPLPFTPPRPLKYYVVIKGYKIGIFMEKWYVNIHSLFNDTDDD